LNVDTANGSTNPLTAGGSLSPRLALSSNAGSDASDDRELNATACAGNAALAKRRNPTRPPITASGYNRMSSNRKIAQIAST